MKRVFLIVLDSFGIGEMPDASVYHDEGSNTLASCARSPYFSVPNMGKLGLFNIDGVTCKEKERFPSGSFGRMTEASKGKDTTTGHWEIAGLISHEPMPVFPDGFPRDLLERFEEETGKKVICNRPYSGTKVIQDYGEEHIRTGALIVYTSADSVFQIAAHENVVPAEQLYRHCETARRLCQGKYGVGRVIARPFTGRAPDFVRTSGRHDYSLLPPEDTMLDILAAHGKQVISVGKINDIFAGKGITSAVRTTGNEEGIEKTLSFMQQDFEGICFTNLVDFDMLYGHRNDVDGYAGALAYFDRQLPRITERMKEEDILMITADHGCDPLTLSTDHSREYTPLLIVGKGVKEGVNLGTRNTFGDIAATIIDYFGLTGNLSGESFLKDILSKQGEKKRFSAKKERYE